VFKVKLCSHFSLIPNDSVVVTNADWDLLPGWLVLSKDRTEVEAVHDGVIVEGGARGNRHPSTIQLAGRGGTSLILSSTNCLFRAVPA